MSKGPDRIAWGLAFSRLASPTLCLDEVRQPGITVSDLETVPPRPAVVGKLTSRRQLAGPLPPRLGACSVCFWIPCLRHCPPPVWLLFDAKHQNL
jgi:hypothetical protein